MVDGRTKFTFFLLITWLLAEVNLWCDLLLVIFKTGPDSEDFFLVSLRIECDYFSFTSVFVPSALTKLVTRRSKAFSSGMIVCCMSCVYWACWILRVLPDFFYVYFFYFLGSTTIDWFNSCSICYESRSISEFWVFKLSYFVLKSGSMGWSTITSWVANRFIGFNLRIEL